MWFVWAQEPVGPSLRGAGGLQNLQGPAQNENILSPLFKVFKNVKTVTTGH